MKLDYLEMLHTEFEVSSSNSMAVREIIRWAKKDWTTTTDNGRTTTTAQANWTVRFPENANWNVRQDPLAPWIRSNSNWDHEKDPLWWQGELNFDVGESSFLNKDENQPGSDDYYEEDLEEDPDPYGVWRQDSTSSDSE